MTSTLVVYEISVSGRPPIDERVYDILAPEIAAEVREIAIARRAGRGAIDPALFAKAMEYERAFVAAGGLLAAGVDPTGYGAAPPGFGDQRNYELLLEAGFSAPEVIQIMSLNGAKILGIDEDVGTIEAGKIADLVVVDADLESVGNLHDTSIVFRHGIGWDSAKLIDSVRGIVGIR
jgi:imidazolonepropionase-like amidohydrolase